MDAWNVCGLKKTLRDGTTDRGVMEKDLEESMNSYRAIVVLLFF